MIVGSVRAYELARLDAEFPPWRDVIGDFGSGTAYRRWLEMQDEDYQDAIYETHSSTLILDSLLRFFHFNRVHKINSKELH